MSTAKPAAACIWASSKNVSPYCVNGPPWTLSSSGYRRRDSKPSGRMSQASISPAPSAVGTTNFSQPRKLRVTAVTGPSSVTISAGCSTVAWAIAMRPPRAS